MTFDNLLKQSREELALKTEAHRAWGLGSFDQWDLDQDDGNLIFSNDDGTRAIAPAQIIGTYNTQDETWLWAWDNPSIVDALTLHARGLKKFGEENELKLLVQRKWIGEESDAWDMTALAVKLCDAQGAYRGPTGDTNVYMTFGKVQVSNTDRTEAD